MTINVNNYTRTRYGNEEQVSAHQRGDAHKPIPHESGYYYTDRQIAIMHRRKRK
jgi:hypothetical protein